MANVEKAVGARRDPFSELELFGRSSPFQRGGSPWRRPTQSIDASGITARVRATSSPIASTNASTES